MHATFRVGHMDHKPTHATDGSAGIDMPVQEDQTVKPGEIKIINLKTSIKIPKKTCGIISIRFWAAQLGLINLGTIIDQDYTGPIFATVTNLGKKKICIKTGIAFCQITIVTCLGFGQPMSSDKTKEYIQSAKGDRLTTTEDHLLVRQDQGAQHKSKLCKDDMNIPTAPPAYELCDLNINLAPRSSEDTEADNFKIVVHQSCQTDTLWSRVRASMGRNRFHTRLTR
jgi:dUTPase